MAQKRVVFCSRRKVIVNQLIPSMRHSNVKRSRQLLPQGQLPLHVIFVLVLGRLI
jgi:hypothetical protein